jgi:hypothetical protein
MNPPLRATLDASLIGRVATFLAFMKLSASMDGTNPLCVDPLTVALTYCKITPANFGEVTDDDLITVTDAKTALKIVDIAEYRLLCTLQNNFTYVTTQVGDQSEIDWSDLLKNLDSRTGKLLKELQAKYGFGMQPLVSGRIVLNNITTDPNRTWPLFPCPSWGV